MAPYVRRSRPTWLPVAIPIIAALLIAGCPSSGVSRGEPSPGDVAETTSPEPADPEPEPVGPVEPEPEPGLPAPPAPAPDAPGAELLGTTPPPWRNGTWVGSEPLALADLRGDVVLVRFWTDTCPYCRASAPGLSQLHGEYADEGLRVIGVYHPKPPREETAASVKEAMERIGIDFPVALDNDWATLRAWWLQRRRAATSASFLLDRAGKIRHIHPGPELHPDPSGEHPECDADFRTMEAWVRKLLAEKPPS